MNKLWKIIQFGYIIAAIILVIESIISWNSDRSKAYFYIIFAILFVILFYFKRHFRKKIEAQNQHNK